MNTRNLRRMARQSGLRCGYHENFIHLLGNFIYLLYFCQKFYGNYELRITNYGMAVRWQSVTAACDL